MNTSIAFRRALMTAGALALLTTACSSDTSPTTTTNQQTTTTTAQPAVVSAEELLEDFADFWVAANWDGIVGISEPGVAGVAEQLGQPDDVSVVWIPECAIDGTGTASCDLLVYAGEGSALVYWARYGAAEDGALSIIELVPAGDAG